MLRLLTASSILALATVPAIAQQADPMATPPASEVPATNDTAPMQSATPATPATPANPATPADPSTGTPAQPATGATPATPAQPATPAAPSKESTVAQLVESEFPTYDADKNGELSQAEFSTWVLALHSKAEEKGGVAKKDDAAKTKWAKDAFATADTDKNKKVSKSEISKFLLG